MVRRTTVAARCGDAGRGAASGSASGKELAACWIWRWYGAVNDETVDDRSWKTVHCAIPLAG